MNKSLYTFMYDKNIWLDFYNSIKDPTWPSCFNEHEFQSLPAHIKQEIIDQHNGNSYVTMTDCEILDLDPKTLRWNSENFDASQTEPVPLDYDGPVECKHKFFVASDFAVQYDDYMYGFGSYHCQFYPKVIRLLYPDRVFDHCLEWCAGAGFIGYRLLSDGLVRSVDFMDKCRPSLTAVQNTFLSRPERLRHAQIHTIWESNIASIGDQKYDLIVANPPCFENPDLIMTDQQHRITQDPGWQIHAEFFHNIGKNLTDDGIILLMKHVYGSQPGDHVHDIDQGGLVLTRAFTTSQTPDFHFMEIRKK